MRFLIVVSAALACAAAAPSHLVPFAPYTVQAVALPAALPTISSGDLQAAAIDANVKAADLAQEAIDKARLVSDMAAEDFNVKAADLAQESIDKARLVSDMAAEDFNVKGADLAQEAVDKARLASDIAAEDLNVKAAYLAQEAVDKARLVSDITADVQSISNIDQEKERLTESFWATEDKKWQALDALKTAEAQFDGAVASKADILAKSAIVAPYVAPFPAVAPIAPFVYSGFNPALKSFSSQSIVQTHPEAAKAAGESEKAEAAVKAAEPAIEKAEAEKKSVEAAAELKSEADKAFAALQAPVIVPVAGAFPYAGYTGAFPYSSVAVAPVALAQPGFKYATTIQHSAVPAAAATSTFFKTQW